MHPPYPLSSMTRLACTASLGLMITTTLGLSVHLSAHNPASQQTAALLEDDRGSGRLSRLPTIAELLSFRGSGRVEPTTPSRTTGWHSPLAYRGSGRVTQTRS
ncbi:hypothetical protein [Nodosilinea sp. E11]|uniref:hypothetical protein n=1 Tax=Nodosilinea sp. E11 TaxID=3037479 RepID=UPI0029341396|nr:hypothetical protein [Nodosilinea sp. E11]WOD37815.1 hypothetical protein RRF56_16510 [Nodosilinea sp. E11]